MKASFYLILIYLSVTINNALAGTLVLQPYGSQGVDCEIWTIQPSINKSGYARIIMNAWTWNGVPGVERSLMNFNWALVPAGATITSASLSLYGNVGSTENHSTLSGSNAFYINRVTSPWNASTVTWNSQPSTDNVHQASLPQSVGQYDDYLNIDVTQMVQDIVYNPGSYYGFMFQLQNENYYRRMSFKSADQPDSARFPTLTINYVVNGTCLSLNPYGSMGEDCEIWSVQPDSNKTGYARVVMNAWTWSGTPGIERSLMNFNWGLIPSNAVINSATLSLYGNVGSTENDNPLSGSNASYINRVTSSWSSSTVTWNTQPSTDNVHQISLPQTVGQYDDFLNIDVLAMVQDIVGSPSSYHGFMFMLQNENYYRRVCFKSADQPDTSRFPKLTICYTLNGTSPPNSNFHSSKNIFCNENGECIDFYDLSSGNPTSWKWYFPGAIPDTSTQQNPTGICYYVPGTYSVSLVISNSNGKDSLKISPMITFASGATAPVVTQKHDTLTSSHAVAYQWYFNGSPIAGATDSFYVANTYGNYAVLITDSLGCSRISTGVLASVNELSYFNEISIYPNPSHGIIYISSEKEIANAVLNIFNSIGEKVYSQPFRKEQKIPDNYLSKGVYLVMINGGTRIWTSKMVVD